MEDLSKSKKKEAVIAQSSDEENVSVKKVDTKAASQIKQEKFNI